MRLWIDDLRPDPDTEFDEMNGWVWIKTLDGALLWLKENQHEDIEEISFDHDLGIGPDGYTENTRPVLTWLIENDVWPRVVAIHSANFVGREWLRGTADRYAPDSVIVRMY